MFFRILLFVGFSTLNWIVFAILASLPLSPLGLDEYRMFVEAIFICIPSVITIELFFRSFLKISLFPISEENWGLVIWIYWRLLITFLVPVISLIDNHQATIVDVPVTFGHIISTAVSAFYPQTYSGILHSQVMFAGFNYIYPVIIIAMSWVFVWFLTILWGSMFLGMVIKRFPRFNWKIWGLLVTIACIGIFALLSHIMGSAQSEAKFSSTINNAISKIDKKIQYDFEREITLVKDPTTEFLSQNDIFIKQDGYVFSCPKELAKNGNTYCSEYFFWENKTEVNHYNYAGKNNSNQYRLLKGKISARQWLLQRGSGIVHKYYILDIPRKKLDGIELSLDDTDDIVYFSNDKTVVIGDNNWRSTGEMKYEINLDTKEKRTITRNVLNDCDIMYIPGTNNFAGCKLSLIRSEWIYSADPISCDDMYVYGRFCNDLQIVQKAIQEKNPEICMQISRDASKTWTYSEFALCIWQFQDSTIALQWCGEVKTLVVGHNLWANFSRILISWRCLTSEDVNASLPWSVDYSVVSRYRKVYAGNSYSAPAWFDELRTLTRKDFEYLKSINFDPNSSDTYGRTALIIEIQDRLYLNDNLIHDFNKLPIEQQEGFAEKAVQTVRLLREFWVNGEKKDLLGSSAIDYASQIKNDIFREKMLQVLR